MGNFGFNEAFGGTNFTTDIYDSILQGWANLDNPPQNLLLQLPATYCSSASERQILISTHGWTINDEGESNYCTNAFITTWKTDNIGSSQDNQITIPTFFGETYDYTVDWGDGTSDENVTGDITHTYASPGTYQVAINGIFPRIIIL